MKVYVAGPIAGQVNGNREAFQLRVKQLQNMGHEPINPWDISPDHDETVPHIGPPVDHEEGPHGYGCYLRSDLEVLITCQGYSLLDGWEFSRGASTEEHVARSIYLTLVEVGA